MEIEKKLRVDLGCGENKKEGFTGVDICQLDGVDIVHDLEVFPWPFEDGSVDEAHSSHYIEHTGCLMKFMNELYRVLKPKGQALLIAPYYTSERCWQDPTHKRAISAATFCYYNLEWRKANKLTHYPISCDFDFAYSYVMDASWANRSTEARDFAVRHYHNVVSDIIVTVTKREA